MKKLLIAICCTIVIIAAQLIWQDQSRDYYCFSDGKCFTIWKRVGTRNCYLIPGRYHGVVAPKDGYVVKTDMSKYLGVISDKKRPDKIIVEGDSSCALIQTKPGRIVFYNDEGGNKEFDSLYAHDGSHYNHDVEYYSVDLFEMYATSNVKGYKAVTGISTWTLLSIVVFYTSILLLFVLLLVLIVRLMVLRWKKRSTPAQ